MRMVLTSRVGIALFILLSTLCSNPIGSLEQRIAADLPVPGVESVPSHQVGGRVTVKAIRHDVEPAPRHIVAVPLDQARAEPRATTGVVATPAGDASPVPSTATLTTQLANPPPRSTDVR